MSLLTLVQDVCGRLGLTVPAAVAGSADPMVAQMMALASKAGHDLAQAHPWQALTAEQTFATVAGAAQPGALPADFDRVLLGSMFNRTTRRPVEGPLAPDQWQARAALPALDPAVLAWRERGGVLMLSPVPPAGQTIAFEYVSANFARSAGGSPRDRFLADDDTAVVDEALLADALAWMFLAAKGLDFGEALSVFQRNLDQAKARDGGSAALALAPDRVDPARIGLPDGSFPGG
jgi:hypothetical protein